METFRHGDGVENPFRSGQQIVGRLEQPLIRLVVRAASEAQEQGLQQWLHHSVLCPLLFAVTFELFARRLPVVLPQMEEYEQQAAVHVVAGVRVAREEVDSFAEYRLRSAVCVSAEPRYGQGYD